MQNFREIPAEELENITRLFAKDWALITAGNEQAANTMVGGWGGAGYMWKKPVVSCVIRPQRYTYEFVEWCYNFDNVTCNMTIAPVFEPIYIGE